MDMVRQALGDDQINYLGYSYGTELGTAYLERFSDHVRAMVLDGAIDPTVDPIDENVKPDGGIPDRLQRLRRRLRPARRPARWAPTRPSGSTATTRWWTRWSKKPGKTSDPRGLSYADATTGTINALYTPQQWKYLTSGLLGLQQRHRRRRPADARRRLRRPRQARALHQRPGRVQRGPLRRRAGARPIRRAWASADQQVRQAAPFLSYGQFTGNAPARHLRAVAGAGDDGAAPAAARPRRARSSSSPRRATRPPRTRPALTWPTSWAPR